MRCVGWTVRHEHARQVSDRRGVLQVHVELQESGTCGALMAVQGCLCALNAPLQRVFLRLSARARGWLGEHCVHLLVPAGVAEDTVSDAPQRWQVCWR